MKRKLQIFASLIAIVLLAFVAVSLTKASNDADYAPTLTGAQIRTSTDTNKQGFKFTATVSDAVDFSDKEKFLDHGFFIAKGTYSYDELTEAVLNNQENITQEDGAITSRIVRAYTSGTNNTFSVTVMGLNDPDSQIQLENFLTNVTVVAYVCVKADNEAGYKYIFSASTDHLVRNIAYVALNSLEGGEFDPENYTHMIAEQTHHAFVRASVTNEKVTVTRSIYEADGSLADT